MTTIFISKMEGLPPTSYIKMIDIWLILCQLVPFAQVVLLTAMEYLREEEQDCVEDDDIQQQATTEENPEITIEDETKPTEAWASSQKRSSKVSTVTLLSIIGKVNTKFLILTRNALAEKKVLPLSVLFASIVYFAIAASFYFE